MMSEREPVRRFPVVQAEGSHYEVGGVIGQTLKVPIIELLEANRRSFGDAFAQYIEISKAFLAETETHFPQYVTELHGIADGAGVPFEELFLSNNREVADFGAEDPNHCTIIAVPHEGSFLVGHNEDWTPTALPHLYILDATIDGVRIFGLNYANNLIGASVAVNGFGLLEAVNELHHHDAQVGIPKDVIARAILDCQTLEEAEHIIKTYRRGGGFNHVLVQGNRLWNIESSATDSEIEKREGETYVHTNHYLTRLVYLDKGTKESRVRYDKVSQLLPQVETVEDIKATLSDKTDPPVCRPRTIGSVIFDLSTHVAHVAHGQPTKDSYYEMKW